MHLGCDAMVWCGVLISKNDTFHVCVSFVRSVEVIEIFQLCTTVARIQVGRSSEMKEDRRMRLTIYLAEQVIVVVLVDWIVVVVDVLVK